MEMKRQRNVSPWNATQPTTMKYILDTALVQITVFSICYVTLQHKTYCMYLSHMLSFAKRALSNKKADHKNQS